MKTLDHCVNITEANQAYSIFVKMHQEENHCSPGPHAACADASWVEARFDTPICDHNLDYGCISELLMEVYSIPSCMFERAGFQIRCDVISAALDSRWPPPHMPVGFL